MSEAIKVDDENENEMLLKDVFEATKMGYVQAVKALLRGVPKPRLAALLARRDSQGHTLAHWAAQAGKVPILQLLNDMGAPMFEKSDDDVGMTPLHWACWQGHTRAARLLLEMGEDIDSLDNAQCTPLIIASQHGNAACAALMIRMGANPSAKDANLDSALHWAAYKGDMTIVGLLDYLGVSVQEDDKYGQTPLHLAALRGNMEVVEYLVLDRNVRTSVTDNEGATPLQLAERKGQAKVARFLKRHSIKFWQRPFSEICSVGFVLQVLGFDQSRSQEDMKWPFYVLVTFTIWNHVVFFLFLNADEMLYDSMFTMGLFLLFAIVKWTAFILTWRSDPGIIKDSDGALERRYKEALDDIEALGDGSSQLNLCHTCHIVRPLRSKHCRVTRRCVRDFDHYCPFVQNTVGQGNYRYFFMYLITLQIGMDIWIYLAALKLYRGGWHWVVGLSLIAHFPFWSMSFGMCMYHVQLVLANLTTNEYSNRYRYDYLKDAAGGFFNPYNKGFLYNVLDRFCADRADEFEFEQPPPQYLNFADIELGGPTMRSNSRVVVSGAALDRRRSASAEEPAEKDADADTEQRRPLLSAN
uniref:Palmitoyltransferase n=1 Tax=Pinguiococcus pyrenoidosus TaxID=172671 RepID=A0A6U0TF19_9STRA